MIPCCFLSPEEGNTNQFLKHCGVKKKRKKLVLWMVSEISVLKKKVVGFVLCVNATGYLH